MTLVAGEEGMKGVDDDGHVGGGREVE